jgi:hypothetical protein
MNINIDPTDIMNQFNVPENDIKQFVGNIVAEIATNFESYWNKETSVLKSSRQEYKQGIYREQIDETTFVVGLVGWLPNAIEQGIEGFDEKEGFMKSSKKHEKKGGGWYLTIPFRHAVSSSLGESEIFSGVMPKAVSKEARKLGNTNAGLNVKSLPSEYQIPKIRQEVVTKSKVFAEYQNKASIYAGIQRKVDSTGRGNYFSFRRVSDKSDDNSWINSGIEARNFSQKALDNMDIVSMVDDLAGKYIEQLV